MAVSEVYELGGHRVGVRWSRAGLDAELRAIAAAAVGPEHAPPNLSIVLGEARGRTRTKHQLFVQGQLVCTTASDGALVRAVVRALGALVTPPTPGVFELNGVVVLDADGAATVVDRRLTGDLHRLEPRLRRAGHCIVDVLKVRLDPASGTAVLPDGAGLAGIAVDRLAARWPGRGAEDDLRAGAVPVRAVVYQGRSERDSRAAVIADVVPLLRGADNRTSTGDVAKLVELASRCPVQGVPAQERAKLAQALGLRS